MSMLGDKATREIVHVDMDAFFASVEQRDDPALRGKCVLVGGGQSRGVVAAASYEARRFGVHSAMPMAEAMRRCPQAIVVAPKRGRYEEVSAQIFEIFNRYTPLVEGLSVDEAFLDVSQCRGLFGDGKAIATAIRAAILAELELTASAGVAPSKFVAKIASDIDKPDGLTVVAPDEVQAFLAPLPIEKMWGVGPKAAEKLRGAGFWTVGELSQAPPEQLVSLLGTWGRSVHELARGYDPREVIPHRDAKSIGAEQTYASDLRTQRALDAALLVHSATVARRLVRAGLCASTLTLKIKYSDFRVKTRQRKLMHPVDDTTSIQEVALGLLSELPPTGKAIRLAGISASGLQAGPPPRTLFDESQDRRRAVETAMASLEGRYGEKMLTRAQILTAPGREAPPQIPGKLAAPKGPEGDK